MDRDSQSAEKQAAIATFAKHVSSGKAAVFEQFDMSFVPGRRQGPFLWDMDGRKRLFNLHCNGGVFNLGHRHPETIAALTEALADVDIGNHHLMSRARADLAGMLAQLMPGDLGYTVFGVGGGEAVDLAIKTARAYTQKTAIVSALGGYHGHTGLALATGDEKYRRPFGPRAPGFRQVPFGDLAAMEAACDEDTAAVILETVPATLGIVIPPRDYFSRVHALCRRRGCLLILDEIQTGLGRTGRLWGFEHFGVVPDMVVLGKGLSGGVYPISATVMRNALEAVFRPDPFIHVSTFGGAEVGCRVARRVLEISADAAFLAHVNLLAGEFARRLDGLVARFPDFLKQRRQLGLMMGLVLADGLCGPLMTKCAYDRDLLLIYANNDPRVCQLLPPLTMGEEQLDWVVERLALALDDARGLRAAFGENQSTERRVE